MTRFRPAQAPDVVPRTLPRGFGAGLLSITVGTLFAMTSIPLDVGPAEALFEPALILALALLFGPMFRASRSPTTVLRVENVLMAGLIYWLLLDPLQSAYGFEAVSRADVEIAFGAIGAFALALWIGAAGRGWRPPRFVRNAVHAELSDWQLFAVTIACFLLGSFYFFWQASFNPATIIDSLLASRFAAAWSRGAFGDWDAFIEHLSYFGFALPALCMLLARRHSWRHPRVLIAIFLTLLMLAFLAQSGGRRIAGMLLGGGLFCWVITSRQLRFKVIVGVLAGLAAILLILQTMLHYRTIGWGAVLTGEEVTVRVSHLHVDDNLLRLAQITSIFPKLRDYAGWDPLVYVAVRPIPRVLWPGKPVDAGYDLAAFINERGVSLTSSIVGDLYAIYGFLAVVIGGFLMGRLATMLNYVLMLPGSVGRPIVFSLGLMALFIALRAIQEFVVMGYGVIGWCVISRFFSERKATSRPA